MALALVELALVELALVALALVALAWVAMALATVVDMAAAWELAWALEAVAHREAVEL